MEKVIILILLLVTFYSFSSTYQKVIKFRVTTKSGGILFGIALNQQQADLLLNRYQNQNLNTVNDILGAERLFFETTIVNRKSKNPLDRFLKEAPDGYILIPYQTAVEMNLADSATKMSENISRPTVAGKKSDNKEAEELKRIYGTYSVN